MASITLKGSPIETCGALPAVGTQAPGFSLVKADLSEVGNKDFSGRRLILNIFPSIDTPVCATSVRTFNERAASLDNTAVLCVSADLPFALGRFCGAEGIEKVDAASDFRSGQFARDYGVRIETGPLAGVMARAIVVLDETGKVLHSELVPEIAQEPDYDAALSCLG